MIRAHLADLPSQLGDSRTVSTPARITVLPSRREFPSRLVPRLAFDRLLDQLGFQLPTPLTRWPKETWFRWNAPGERGAFLTADCYVHASPSRVLGFIEGRHRTAWLMLHPFEHLPIGLSEASATALAELGVPSRLVDPEYEIELR